MRVFWLTMVAFLIYGQVVAVNAATHHYYFNGRVVSRTDTQLVFSDRQFPLAAKVKVVEQVMRYGAFFEETSRLSYVSPGNFVTVKVDSALVTEIIIERWK